MGITCLSKKINVALKNVHISEFKNKKIAIDVSIYMYSFLRQPQDNSLLKGFIKQIKYLRSNQITPVYIFDGVPLKEKLVIEKRRNEKQNNKEKIRILDEKIKKDMLAFNELSVADGENTDADVQITLTPSNIDDIHNIVLNSNSSKKEEILETVCTIRENCEQLKKSKLANLYPTKTDVAKLKKLFTIYGVPFFQADTEADVLCAQMCKTGLVDGVISCDTDFLVYGCPFLITNISNVTGICKVYYLEEVLSTLGLQMSQFIDMCILCGCDYSSKISKVAVFTAYNFIVKHKTIENVIEYINSDEKLKTKFQYSENFLDQVNTARSLFNLTHELIAPSDKELTVNLKQIDKAALRAFLDENKCTQVNKNVCRIILS
jgi:5'-3' exonuclease